MARSKKTRFLRRVKRNLKRLDKRTIICALLLQVLFICFLVNGINDSKTIKPEDTQQVTIVVEETKHFESAGGRGPDWFIVYSDSQKFYFNNFGFFAQYSNSQLDESISVGEKLTLTYFEKYHLFANRNFVVDARSESEVFRTLDEYNKNFSYSDVAAIIIFCILEIIFWLFASLFIIL